MKKIDKEIINIILRHIGDDDKLEEDIASDIERYLDVPVDFSEWLVTFKPK